MPRLKLQNAYLDGAKADFVKHSINVRLVLPLNDENLKLRSTLAFLSMEKTSVTVEIESAQLPLFDMDKPPSDSENNIAASVEDERTFQTEFENAAKETYGGNVSAVSNFTRDVLNKDESETRPRKRKKGDDTLVTLSAPGHAPVTITAKQLKDAANADPANLVRKSKIERMKITKRKK